mmetsp:Transcript_15498/g.47130  ORF Transcript_15498/g.47130 Transcript_15498/m.47130 type:complete len:122 (+) Transcript_15498:1112-1477(+)
MWSLSATSTQGSPAQAYMRGDLGSFSLAMPASWALVLSPRAPSLRESCALGCVRLRSTCSSLASPSGVDGNLFTRLSLSLIPFHSCVCPEACIVVRQVLCLCRTSADSSRVFFNHVSLARF